MINANVFLMCVPMYMALEYTLAAWCTVYQICSALLLLPVTVFLQRDKLLLLGFTLLIGCCPSSLSLLRVTQLVFQFSL